MALIFGGGGIAEEGIAPLLDCHISRIDVRDAHAVERVVAEHAPRAVIYTAGVSHPGRIGEDDAALWHHEIDVNLIGAYHVARAAVRNHVDTLIFIASVAGLYGKPNHSGYSASKAALISLVQSLAMEGHDAYAISPGRVDTKMREQDYPGEDPRTRLSARQVGEVVQEILDGEHDPGDNLIIRKIGYDTYRRVDRGVPWKGWLKVGQPAVM